MAYVWQRWIADELRAAGLEVIEIEGWKNRGRPASTGNFNPTEGVTTHHTGSTSSATVTQPSLAILITGRSDLPGPLCQVATTWDGKVIVIAAGRANHAGAVGKPDCPGMPLGADGNALALGNEVMTNGTQELPAAQRHAIAVVNAVFLKHYRNGPKRAHRHADISGSGKWDIGSLTTEQLRADARTALNNLEEDDMKPEDFEKIKALVEEATLTAVKSLLSEKQANGKTVLENIRIGANARDLVREVIDQLDALEEATPPA
jgi:hypothetical protein